MISVSDHYIGSRVFLFKLSVVPSDKQRWLVNNYGNQDRVSNLFSKKEKTLY